MIDTNFTNSSHACAEPLISYLYNELSANETQKFESHLRNCPVCADEVSGFKLVRSSIFEWREADFSNLETPAFELPIKPKKFVAAENSGSRLAAFWKQFAFRPIFAAVALLVVFAVCIGAYLAFNFTGNREIAENSGSENSAKIIADPKIEKIEKESLTQTNGGDNQENSSPKNLAKIADASDLPIKSAGKNQVVAQTRTVKISKNAAKNYSAAVAQNISVADKNAKKTSSNRKTQASGLNDSEDEEDDSIRLTDLFADIDTK